MNYQQTTQTTDLAPERALLGALLIGAIEDPASIFEALKSEDFQGRDHARIFQAMALLHGRRSRIDPTLVGAELRQAGKLRNGDQEYLEDLAEGAISLRHVDEYVDAIQTVGRRHALAAMLREALTKCGEGSVEHLIDDTMERLAKFRSDGTVGQAETKTYRETAMTFLLQLEDKNRKPKIRSGIQALDALTGGFGPGELIVLTAATGIGKTVLAAQVRAQACSDGLHTLFATAEMTAEHLVSRDLATEAEVARFKFRCSDELTHSDIDALMQAAAHQCPRCRLMDGEVSLSRIRRGVRQMKAAGGIDLLVIDYDELVEAPGQDEFDQQRNLVVGAKKLAIEYLMPVILISQLRKTLQGEDRKRPTLERLYGTGSKAKHASIVVFTDRPFVRELQGDETEATICVLKNRNGRVGPMSARFNVHSLRFEDAPASPTKQPEKAERKAPEQRLPYRDGGEESA